LDFKQCKQECEAKTECQALTYNTRARACFLKTNITTITQNDNAIVAYRAELRPQIKLSSLQFLPGTEILGQVIEEALDVNYVDCIRRCDENTECQAFTHRSKPMGCRLLKSVEHQRANVGMASGHK
jgi:hypothetical protein